MSITSQHTVERLITWLLLIKPTQQVKPIPLFFRQSSGSAQEWASTLLPLLTEEIRAQLQQTLLKPADLQWLLSVSAEWRGVRPEKGMGDGLLNLPLTDVLPRAVKPTDIAGQY